MRHILPFCPGKIIQQDKIRRVTALAATILKQDDAMEEKNTTALLVSGCSTSLVHKLLVPKHLLKRLRKHIWFSIKSGNFHVRNKGTLEVFLSKLFHSQTFTWMFYMDLTGTLNKYVMVVGSNIMETV